METVKFKQWNCTIEKKTYIDGNPALMLIGIDLPVYDNKVAVATTNLEGLNLNEVAIKDYSENEGMYRTLLDAGIIQPAHKYQDSGWVKNIPICYLTENNNGKL